MSPDSPPAVTTTSPSRSASKRSSRGCAVSCAGPARRSPRDAEPILRVGDLTLNEDSHEVERSGDQIELTATEFELLRFLMRNQRRVVSKAQILDRVWNYDFGGRSSVVELYISYLRKKIDAGREPLIHTVRGVGYMIKAPQ